MMVRVGNLEFTHLASVREELREGNLKIGVGAFPYGHGSFETFLSRPAAKAPKEFGDAYIILLEDGRQIVADRCDLTISEKETMHKGALSKTQ